MFIVRKFFKTFDSFFTLEMFYLHTLDGAACAGICKFLQSMSIGYDHMFQYMQSHILAYIRRAAGYTTLFRQTLFRQFTV